MLRYDHCRNVNPTAASRRLEILPARLSSAGTWALVLLLAVAGTVQADVWARPLDEMGAPTLVDGVTTNLAPGDYEAITLDQITSCELIITNGMLAVVSEATGTLPYQPADDDTALLIFYGERSTTSIRFDPDDHRYLDYTDFRMRRLDSIPILPVPCGTNGLITANETILYRIPVIAGHTYTLDIATTNTIQATLSSGDDVIARANTGHAFHVVPETDGEYVLSINRDGPNPGPFRLTIHTNAIPFYAAVPFDQWPTALAGKAHLFPRTEFGYVFVQESREKPSGNVLKLAVAKIASTNATAMPLIFCNGGPGNWSIYSWYQYYLRTHFGDYDIYLPDQRGVGFSQPNLDLRPGENSLDALYRIKFLQGGDYTTVHTVESARDLIDIHAALQLGDDVNLWGLSYGTMLAGELMRFDPPWLRSVILDGILAPNLPPYRQVGAVNEGALANLFHDVATDPDAARLYPEFETTYKQFAAQLQADPMVLHVQDWEFAVDGVTLIYWTTLAMLHSDLGNRHNIPGIVWRAMRGETDAFLDLITFPGMTDEIMYNGYTPLMNQIVLRHDFLPFESQATVSNANATLWSPLREYANFYVDREIIPALQIPDVGSAGPTFTQRLDSAIATLCINGFYDPSTGTDWAIEVASQLPNSHLVLMPYVGHGVLRGGDCAIQITRAFLADPASTPDTSCIDTMTLAFPPPWPAATQALALGQPVTNQFPNAGSAVWYEATVYSNIVYDFAGSGVDLQVVDTNADVLHEARGPSSWRSGANGSVRLWLVADEPVTNVWSMELPLLMRDVAWNGDAFTLMWQGPTGTVATIQATDDLTVENSFSNIVTGIEANHLLHQRIIPLGTETGFYFRITQPTP